MSLLYVFSHLPMGGALSMFIDQMYFFCDSLCLFCKTCFFPLFIELRDCAYFVCCLYLFLVYVLSFSFVHITFIHVENFYICANSFLCHDPEDILWICKDLDFCKIDLEEGTLAGDLGTFWVSTFMMSCSILGGSLQFSFILTAFRNHIRVNENMCKTAGTLPAVQLELV